MTADLGFSTVEELARLIRTRRVSPADVTRALLDRIEEYNSELGAFTHVDVKGAMAAARQAEAEIISGRYRGPLHGIPLAYKDVLDVSGLPTTAASRLLLDNVPVEDSEVVRRLRGAGAICLGKLNTLEFACGGTDVFGDARNPWDTTRSPGGSSAGPGVALSAGLIPIAIGTDTGGSIRLPASFCGVVGLKPTYGRVSRAGVVPLSWSLDHVGPMGRTVADVALVLEAIAGWDGRDPSTSKVDVPPYTRLLSNDVRGVRLGLPRRFLVEGLDSHVERNFDGAVQTLVDLGAETIEIDLPSAQFGPAAAWTIEYTEAYAYHQKNLQSRPHDYTSVSVQKIGTGAFFSAEERLIAQRIRQVITGEYMAALRTVDVIVTPTTAHPPFPIGGSYAEGDPGRLTRPVSLTGFPAISICAGFTPDGLPTSLQITGRAWSEATVLRVADAYQRATEWHLQRAPIMPGRDPEAVWSAPLPTVVGRASDIGSDWIMAVARLLELHFVSVDNCDAIAKAIGPIKASLGAVRRALADDVEPPIRTAPT